MNKLIPFEHLTTNISRRDFLRFCGLGLFGLMLPERFVENYLSKFRNKPDEQLLGRITRPGEKLFESPDSESKAIKYLYEDDLFKITGVTIGENKNAANRVWYQLDGLGFSHSRYIQPVYEKENKTKTVIPADGCLGEITVPYVDSYRYMDENSQIVYRLYYSSTFWILKREEDSTGKVWYQLLDDRSYGSFYVPASSVRLVPDSELSAIAQDLSWKHKLIDVDLGTQTLTAYEGDTVVFMSRISSGVRLKEGGFSTPKGRYHTNRKRPCRHMANPPNEFGTGFDLPGVPWVSYFTSDGIAFHGTYWHNDFGVPHSHGCVNMPSQAAKWVYLWTTPTVPPDKYFHSENYGTLVNIH